MVKAATLNDGAPDPEAIWEQLRQVYDPEIPVNIVDLGLVYSMDVEKTVSPAPESAVGYKVNVTMTLTAPGCGMGPAIAEDAKSKVLLVPGVTDADVRRAFRSAAAVVVPVEDVPQPSGQSVTLQASACARPVVLTRTRGLWDPDGLRDGGNVLLVPPADPAALATAVGRILSEEGLGEALGAAARESVTGAASVERYAERLLAICGEALARP